MTQSTSRLLTGLMRWIEREPKVRSAVLFGSHARKPDSAASADYWSDIDLHLIVRSALSFENIDWDRTLSGCKFCMQATRTATGGVRKTTILFEEGEVDLVLVPAHQFHFARFAVMLGLHRTWAPLSSALNNLSTIMKSGYRFVKGEKEWGKFYKKLVEEMPGYRINNAEIQNLLKICALDTFWILEKLDRGELIAAQRLLHRSLVETNIILIHELRLRNGRETFQQARRVEQLLSTLELERIRCGTKLERESIGEAAWGMFLALQRMIKESLNWGLSQRSQQILTARYMSFCVLTKDRDI